MKDIGKQTSLEKLLDLPSQQYDEPKFIKLYFEDLGKLWDLNRNAQRLFGELIKLVEYNPQSTWHNIVNLYPLRKRKVYSALNWKGNAGYVSMTRALSELVTKKVITKIEEDCYLINGDICTKANWGDMKLIKSLTTTVKYEETQRTLITFVEMQPDKVKEEFKSIISTPTTIVKDEPILVKVHSEYEENQFSLL